MTEASPLIPVYKMSVEFTKIFGNSHLKALFSNAVSDNKLPHAIILEGASGSGRYTFALNIAAAALCNGMAKPCYGCKNCRLIFEGVCPDVSLTGLAEGKATIPVDAVREIRNDAQKVPVEGELKFYIIRDADKMTVQAQNALLKILEEPPSFVVFILISENSNLLLSTIRSRASTFRMQRFDDSELAEYVVSYNPKAQALKSSDEASFNRIIKAANGCIGSVLDNLDKRSLKCITDEYTMVTEMLTALCGSSKSDFMAFEDELPSKREELRDSLITLRSAVRDILALKRGSSAEILFFENADDIKRISKTMTLSSVVEIIDRIESTLNANEQNANVNLLKINFMNSLWKCVH